MKLHLVGLLAVSAIAATLQAQTRPNIVVIYTDDKDCYLWLDFPSDAKTPQNAMKRGGLFSSLRAFGLRRIDGDSVELTTCFYIAALFWVYAIQQVCGPAAAMRSSQARVAARVINQ